MRRFYLFWMNVCYRVAEKRYRYGDRWASYAEWFRKRVANADRWDTGRDG